MLKKPSGPSAPKLFLDTQIVPMAVNAAGAFETLLDRSAQRTGVRPSIILAGGAGLILLTVVGFFRHRSTAAVRPS